jgi:hypothetical protein
MVSSKLTLTAEQAGFSSSSFEGHHKMIKNKYFQKLPIKSQLEVATCPGRRMFIPDPGSLFLSNPGSWISDPGSKNNIMKIVNNVIFEQIQKFVTAKTLRILVLFTQTFVIKLSKIWVWDQVVKKAPDFGSVALGRKYRDCTNRCGS